MSDNERFLYRLHPKHIEIDRISLSNELDKQSLYILSVWDQQQQLGQIQQTIKLTKFGNKLLISACSLSFYLQMCNKNLTVKLSAFFGDRLAQIAEGQLCMFYIFKYYQEEHQRYYPEFKCILNFGFGPMTLVFDIYVQKNLYELENYIKQLRQFQKQARNKKIISYKTVKSSFDQKGNNNDIILHIIKEENSSINKSPERLQYLNEQFNNPEIDQQHSENQQNQQIDNSEHFDEEDRHDDDFDNKSSSNRKNKSKQSSSIPMQAHHEPSYLQINSAFVQLNNFKRISNQDTTNNLMGQISKHSLSPSGIVLETSRMFDNYEHEQNQISMISDGSQYSSMVEKNQKQGHSKKAVKNFYAKLRKINNIIMILIAIVLIYIVLKPNSQYQKSSIRFKAGNKKKDKRDAHRI